MKPSVLPLRAVAALLLPAVIFLSVLVKVCAEPGEAGGFGEKLPDPVKSPKNVKVNRTVPKVKPVKTVRALPEQPADAEFLALGAFSEPLAPTRGTTKEENAVFARAVNRWLARQSADDFEAFEKYLDGNGDSPWAMAAMVNLAKSYYRAGWFSKAEAMWRRAWEAGKALTQSPGKGLGDVAAAGLLGMNARVGRKEEAKAILAEIGQRPLEGTAAAEISQARSGVHEMEHTPGKSFRCGPAALGTIRMAGGGNVSGALRAAMEAQSPPEGYNLREVWEMSESQGMGMQMAYREAGSEVIVPAVVNWKLEHYGALTEKREKTRKKDERIHLQDMTFVDDFWMSKEAIDHESSGYFLVPNGSLPAGWRSVGKEEAEKVWGKGDTASSDGDATDCNDPSTCPGENAKMAGYSIHLMLVSLSIRDTPLVYTPPVGPAPAFTASYSQKAPAQPVTFNYANMGSRWTFSWFGYVTYNPNDTLAQTRLYTPSGGLQKFSGFTDGVSTVSPNNAGRLGFESSAVVPGAYRYERINPDGSREVYEQDDGVEVTPATTQKKAFLSQIIDAQGNALTFTYDSMLRIVAATDAIGQVTTITYGLAEDDRKITAVTDPFGRTASFHYEKVVPAHGEIYESVAPWQLVKITDTNGIESQFAYGPKTPTDQSSYGSGGGQLGLPAYDFINKLTTPYGSTTFAYEEEGTRRKLVATDPQGDAECVEYRDNAPGFTAQVDPAPVPGGASWFNNYMNRRNSFYWDKKAWKEAPGDYAKARNYHWMHSYGNVNITGRQIESVKDAYGTRVWFGYDGQSHPAFEGAYPQPAVTARVVDAPSGSGAVSQISRASYNAQRNPTSFTDPKGRVTTLTYAENEIDLLQVDRQGAGTLASYTWNAAHRPLTITDTAGQTTALTYNAQGQALTATNPLGETTANTYNGSGYLTSIDGPLTGAQDTVTISYDGFGRPRTVTGVDGYALTFDYDTFDRITLVTYPDGTTEQIVYNRLDAVAFKDREGKITRHGYNALRQLTSVTDPLGQVTSYIYCRCGDLRSLTDPKLRVTSWKHDAEGRVTEKTFPGGANETYGYDMASRLTTTTDALGQTRTTRHNEDNTPASISYTGAVNPTPNVTLAWDAAFRRLTSIIDGTGTTSFAYNPITGTPTPGANRLASVDGPLANDTITHGYDALGRATSTAINGAANTENTVFDAAGRVTQMTNPLGQFDYDYVGATGRLASAAAPNGLATVFAYLSNAQDRRVQSITNTGPGSAAISAFGYAYSVTGQITDWTQNQSGNTVNPVTAWEIAHDAADQLKSVRVTDGGAVVREEGFAYDGAGNRTNTRINAAVKTGAFNNLNQLTSLTGGGKMAISGTTDEPANVTVQGTPARMLSATNFTAMADVVSGTNTVPVVAQDGSGNTRTNNYQIVAATIAPRTFTYDANGNTLDDGERTYEWDAANRAVKITQGTDIYEYAYNAFNQKVSEKKNGVLTKRWVWAGGTQPAEERDASNTATKRFFGQGEQTLNPQQSTLNFYYTRDHLGSIREVTDASGTVVSSYAYDAWGNRTLLSGTDLATFGYTGHYYHKETDLVFTLFRIYDPELGRWLNRDPIGEAGGVNLYGYVSNNPINFVDPFGLEGWAADLHEQMGGEPGALAQHVQDEGNAISAEMGAAAAAIGIAAIQELAFRGVGKFLGPLKRLFSKCPPAARGLTTPSKYFGSKTYSQVENALTQKFGPPRGQGPFNKSFFNSKTERTFNLHQDPSHRGGLPHIDIRQRDLPTNYYKDRPFYLQGE